MPLNNHDIEQLEKYLSGKLSKEESDALARKLENNAELAEALDDLRAVKMLVDLRQEQNLATALQDIYQKTPYDFLSFLRIHIRKIAGAFVLLAAIGITAFLMLDKNNAVEVKTIVSSSEIVLADSTAQKTPANVPAAITPAAIHGANKQIDGTDSTESKTSLLVSTNQPVKTEEKTTTIEKNTETPVPVVYVPVKKLMPECNEVQWPQATTQPTCNGEPGGVIRLSNSSNIQCALNDSAQYGPNTLFEELKSGVYTLFMKHQNGCSKSQVVTVGTKECIATIRASFAPDAGERWEIPFKNTANEKVTIRDLAGKIVFESTSENFWIGTDMSGNILPAAAYHIIMESSGNVVGTGTVTIIR